MKISILQRVLLLGVGLTLLFLIFPSARTETSPESNASQPALGDEHVSAILSECERIDPKNAFQKEQCWADILENTLRIHGVRAGFELFGEMYQRAVATRGNCHGWGHILGDRVFELYSDAGFHDFVIPKKVRHCSFGFFHGFVERMVQETGNLPQVFRFCQEVKSSVAEQFPGAYLDCLHGAGHGAMSFILENNVELWGDSQKLIDVGAKLCEGALDKTSELEQCYGGIFSELQNSIEASAHGFLLEDFLRREDPFSDCHSQQERRKPACYRHFATLYSFALYPEDFPQSIKIFQEGSLQIPEAYLPLTFQKLSANYMNVDIKRLNQQTHLSGCRSLQPAFRSACLKGMLVGFFTHGKPRDALEFCAAEYLTEQERRFCYSNLLENLYFASLTSLQEVCPKVPHAYRTDILCRTE